MDTDETTNTASGGNTGDDSAQTPPSAGDDGATPANQDSTVQNGISGQLGARAKHLFTIPPHPDTTFDEENFLTLLEGSISLTMEEKKRVIEAIPRLKIEQINELIKIFEEEKQKFSELEKEFSDDVAKLKAEREKEIQMQEIAQEEAGESEGDKSAAEELKKKLQG